MKKKLESELVSIAHRILKLKGREDVVKMHAEVAVLFEKLSVLKFLNEQVEEESPSAGINSAFLDTLESGFNNKKDAAYEAENKVFVNTGDQEEQEDIMVPGIETIKKMVEQMPDETEPVDEVLKELLPEKEILKKEVAKPSLEDIMADFTAMPIFDPVSKIQNGVSNEKKSLNDRIKNGGLNIGLNDKLAFIKHLFEGNNEDYERVMTQLKSIDTYENAQQFIVEIVKLDYNNWVGKEDVEARFLQIIESKYN
ncbi:hypothetical protein [Mariniflexile sp.]|uniref:hypothetical protein n=1 Tax=Mariniflexile sp. TaxID=1979402 RepID=UPI00356A37A0